MSPDTPPADSGAARWQQRYDAALAAARSDHPRALELAQAALRAQWELPDRAGLPATLEVFAELAATDCTGLHHQSAVLLGAAAALRDLTRTPPTPRERAAGAVA